MSAPNKAFEAMLDRIAHRPITVVKGAYSVDRVPRLVWHWDFSRSAYELRADIVDGADWWTTAVTLYGTETPGEIAHDAGKLVGLLYEKVLRA